MAKTSGIPRIHRLALVDCGAHVGARSAVAAFAHICAGARIGTSCEIGEHVLIECGVEIGDRVTIAAGAKVASGVCIEDDVFVGANATLTSRPRVRGPRRATPAIAAVIRGGARIGANATILPDVVIGRTSIVDAGAVVTRNVPPNAIVAGNPAQLQGYVDSIASTGPLRAAGRTQGGSGARTLAIKAAAIHRLPLVHDIRGNLSVAEIGNGLPFAPRRYFVITDVPNDKVRGEHAHRKLQQFLVCLRGRCSVLIDDGKRREDVVLDSPDFGLYVPPMVWAVQYKYSADAVLLVLASAEYDSADYIRDYDEYLRIVRRR